MEDMIYDGGYNKGRESAIKTLRGQRSDDVRGVKLIGIVEHLQSQDVAVTMELLPMMTKECTNASSTIER